MTTTTRRLRDLLADALILAGTLAVLTCIADTARTQARSAPIDGRGAPLERIWRQP